MTDWTLPQPAGQWMVVNGQRRWVPTPPADVAARLREEQARATANDAYWNPVAPVGPASDTPSAAPTSPQLSGDQMSARAILQQYLDEYGLGSLGDRLFNQFLEGQPIDQIMLNLRQSDEYKARFAGMAELQRKGRAINEATYITLERSFAQVMRGAGLPEGLFDDPSDFAKLIGGEVAPTEFAQRVERYSEAMYQAPADVRDQLKRIYGLSDGQMLAYFIDPDRTQAQINTQWQAAQRSAAAQRSGFGALSAGEAEGLVELGVSNEQAQQGFGALVENRELFGSLDSGESEIGREDQIGAAFGGNANAKRRIEERRRRRQAVFEGGGGFAKSEGGMGGVGSAV